MTRQEVRSPRVNVLRGKEELEHRADRRRLPIGGRDDDIVTVYLVTIDFFVQMNVPHDAINKTRGEGSFASVVYVSFEIGGNPKRNVGGVPLDFEAKIGTRIMTAL